MQELYREPQWEEQRLEKLALGEGLGTTETWQSGEQSKTLVNRGDGTIGT